MIMRFPGVLAGVLVTTLTVALLIPVSAPRAETFPAAIAANFTEPAKEIAAAFQAKTGNQAVLSFGASGMFYTQITQGAPYTMLLSADQERPALAVSEGYGVPGSVFTYAVGKLVLWSKAPGLEAGEAALKAGKFDKLALANPKLAPYGAAGIEVLNRLGVYQALAPKIVQGNSIAQTYQFVDTGNAELGFVALSQVIAAPTGSRWIVPETLYPPIRQDAVLLKKGADSAAARAFLSFLKAPQALAIIAKYGYGTVP